MSEAPGPSAGARIPAAQYLRMSAEHQRYSTENQAAAIATYAHEHGYEVVRTYVDNGISGLRLKNRKALQTLLADAMAGEPGFSVILVYDVSRWGRFQDPDQSAHDEFLCSEAGVAIEYCAESFENNGSLSATQLKTLKRVMAAEFSRELSTKVRAGKQRLLHKGFWQQGPAGLGLRRQIVDEHGNAETILEAGQRKAVQSHRVVLTPGPAEEVALVNRIFQLFVASGMTRRGIARLLNAEGLMTDRGVPWSFTTVSSILTNPNMSATSRSTA
jgi:DNA invertase Pin-like site-specific DNA recombinase